MTSPIKFCKQLVASINVNIHKIKLITQILDTLLIHGWANLAIPGSLSLDYFLQAKNLKYQLIFSRDIANQKIMQSNSIRGTPDLNKSILVVSHATFTQ